MTEDDFFNDDTTTSFINKVTAFLNIPFDQLKIVGL